MEKNPSVALKRSLPLQSSAMSNKKFKDLEKSCARASLPDHAGNYVKTWICQRLKKISLKSKTVPFYFDIDFMTLILLSLKAHSKPKHFMFPWFSRVKGPGILRFRHEGPVMSLYKFLFIELRQCQNLGFARVRAQNLALELILPDFSIDSQAFSPEKEVPSCALRGNKSQEPFPCMNLDVNYFRKWEKYGSGKPSQVDSGPDNRPLYWCFCQQRQCCGIEDLLIIFEIQKAKASQGQISGGINQYQSCAGLHTLSSYPAPLKKIQTGQTWSCLLFSSRVISPLLFFLPFMSESLYCCTVKANKQGRLKSKSTHPS